MPRMDPANYAQMDERPANPVRRPLRTPTVRIDDRVRATLMHATAHWSVRYGEELRFSGSELPAPTIIRVPTRHGDVPVHVYLPRGVHRRSAPAYVHFHGGAFLMRHPEMDDFWCRYVERLRAAGTEVLHDVTPGADHYFLSHDLDRARVTMAMTAAEIRSRTGAGISAG